MMRLTWRQFRTQGIVAAGTLAALAITLAVTGPHLAALYAEVAAWRAGSCELRRLGHQLHNRGEGQRDRDHLLRR